jgi:Fe2+ transport system protein B
MSIFSRRQKLQSSRRSQSIKPQTKPSDSQTTGDKLKAGLVSGIKKGWHSFLWMAKILVPLSFAVALLNWSGWLIKVDFVLNPVMNLINLPSEAALPILSGFFINIYAVMAILLVVPFSTGQATLIAVFSMIAHNLITEAIIQHKSGINAFKIVAIRLAVAFH